MKADSSGTGTAVWIRAAWRLEGGMLLKVGPQCCRSQGAGAALRLAYDSIEEQVVENRPCTLNKRDLLMIVEF